MSQANRNERWCLDDWNVTANWVKTYAAGRRCCHDGCKTILSRYNGGTMCDLHKAAPDFMVYLGVRFKVCDTCCRLDFKKAFRRLTPDEYATTCIRCEAKQNRASDRAAKMKTARAKATAGAVRGCLRMVRCSKCNALKPANSRHFTIRLDGRRSSTCLVCERENKARRYATDPEYRERAKASARAAKARCKARGNS